MSISQGVFYLFTSIWPLLSMGSFQRVTGRKTDIWLVRTVALLLDFIGLVLSIAGFWQRLTPETPLLGAGSAASLAGIDLVYAARGRISPVYFLDALVELLFVALWGLVCRQPRAGDTQDS